MIVEITSLAPTVAFSRPAIAAHKAPTTAAASAATTTCGKCAIPTNDEPAHTAAYEPMRYWPWPPMLNSPQRNANATARPVRISGTVWISVCCRFSAAAGRSALLVHGSSQFRPVPSKIALYVLSGLWPVSRITRPPARNAMTTVRSGTTTPPPCTYAARRAAEVCPPPSGPGPPARAAPAAGSSTALIPRGFSWGRGGARARDAALPRAPPPPPAGHRDPELLLGGVGRELADDPPLVDHEDPVRERAHLLGLERHEQDPAAGVALGDQAAMDELDRPDVQPAGRLRGDEHARVAGDLAGDHALLLV